MSLEGLGCTSPERKEDGDDGLEKHIYDLCRVSALYLTVETRCLAMQKSVLTHGCTTPRSHVPDSPRPAIFSCSRAYYILVVNWCVYTSVSRRACAVCVWVGVFQRHVCVWGCRRMYVYVR